MSKQLSHLSYGKILQDIYNFRRSGTKFGSEFNLYDTPGQKYFKLLFYFGGLAEDESDMSFASGLLAPTWDLFNKNGNTQQENTDIETLSESNIRYYNYNSAWAYLKLNAEDERAEKLQQFVSLLSNINSESPWYFTSISGIDAALERKQVTDEKMEISERKKLSLVCLPDAYDNRITTLLELYRDIVYSWSLKREVLPANLRKFDMAIYIFEAPEQSLLYMSNPEEMPVIDGKSGYKPSYKMIEFHNCEIDYNSIKSGWSEINNQTGFNPTYTIDIAYDDCYEIAYNDMIMQTIGDVISTDTLQSVIINNDVNMITPLPQLNSITPNAQTSGLEDKRPSGPTEEQQAMLEMMSQNKIKTLGNLITRTGKQSENINIEYKTRYEPGFIGNALGQVAGTVTADIKSMVKRAVLGNLYTYSLTDIRDTITGALQGNLIPTLERVGVNTAAAGQKGQSVKEFMKNLHGDKAQASSAASIAANTKKKKPTGNIHKNTIANNI